MLKKRGWVILVLTALVVSTAACAAAGSRATQPETLAVERELAPRPSAGPEARDASGAIPEISNVDRKIIYNVSLDLIVRDTEATFDEVQRLTQELGGFISQSNLWSDDEGHPLASVTVRVPVDRLDEALAQYRALAVDVERESVDSQDVTEEYVDLQARLTNEQRTEAELLELLESRSKTGRTEDILEVHRELSQVRSQIEQIQGRIRYLENLSDMATVRITLTPDVLVQPIVVGGWRPQGTARSAIRMLLRTLQFLADAGIVFVLFILPVGIVAVAVLALLFVIGRALWRWLRRPKTQTA
jgi:hypothetical protein